MNEEARQQVKSDCEHEEAKARQTCFFDDLPGTVLVNGAYLCESHAICSTCLQSLATVQAPVMCVCHDYGYAGHEELMWCSLEHMEEAHPERDDVDDTTAEEDTP